MKREGLFLMCALLLALSASSASKAAEPGVEDVHEDLAILAWRIQFHYVWTGEYPQALDQVLKNKPDGEKQTLEAGDIVDPFSPLKLPYGYILSEDGRSFLLYSVGPDGVDEEGTYVYPFWPSLGLWPPFDDRGPGGTVRGDLVIDSKELEKHVVPKAPKALPIASPLLYEYMGAKDLGEVPLKWAESVNEELKKLNTPAELESRRESYLETFGRFCDKHGIEIRALDSSGVDHALARSHAPIPKKTAGRYELLNDLGRACGLRIISGKAEHTPGIARRVLVARGPGEKERAFVLLLEPQWWPGDAWFWFPIATVLTDPTDPGQLGRLAQVCRDVALIRDETLRVHRPCFVDVIREVVGITDEPEARMHDQKQID